MEVTLVKPWRYWEGGCKAVDFKAGLVSMEPDVAKVAFQCGVVAAEKEPEPQLTAEEKPEKKSKKT